MSTIPGLNLQLTLFKQMRTNILQSAFAGVSHSPFSSAYLFAWYAGIYPQGGEKRPLHEPYQPFFSITTAQLQALTAFLQHNSQAHFQQVCQAMAGVFHSDQALKDACRYLFLAGEFDSQLWQHLLQGLDKNSCRCITEPLQADELKLHGDLTFQHAP